MIRKLTKSAIVAFAAITLLLVIASAAQTATVKSNSGLNLRISPSANAKIVIAIPNGSTVSVLQKAQTWTKISYQSKTGYVSTKYLLFKDKTPSSSKTTSRGSCERDISAQKRLNIVDFAENYLGTPYRSGGSAPGGFDCSGFTYYIFKSHGYTLPRGASSQMRGLSVSVSKSDLVPGDLVFFKNPHNPNVLIGHVGMYIGNGKMIHSSSPGDVVKYDTINSGYYATNYVGARRVIS